MLTRECETETEPELYRLLETVRHPPPPETTWEIKTKNVREREIQPENVRPETKREIQPENVRPDTEREI